MPELGPLWSVLEFSNDGKVLFYGKGDSRIGRWNVETMEQLPPIETSSRAVFRLRFTKDEKIAVTSHFGPLTKVWDLPAWKLRYEIPDEYVVAIATREDILFTTSKQELHSRRLSTGERVASQIGHAESLSSAAISPDAPILVTASFDKTVRVWPIEPPEARLLHREHGATNAAFAFAEWPQLSPDARFSSTYTATNEVTIWDAVQLKALRAMVVEDAGATAIAAGGKIVAFGSTKGQLALIDAESGKVISKRHFPDSQFQGLHFSPDGSRLFLARWEFLDMAKREKRPKTEWLPTSNLAAIPRPIFVDACYAIAITRDNRYAAIGGGSSAAELIDLESGGGGMAKFYGHQGNVIDIALTDDTRLVVTVAEDGFVRLFDGRSGALLNRFRGTWEGYNCVAISPDGSRLAAGAGGVDLWDVASFRHVLSFPTGGERIMALGWTSDMSQLTTISTTGLRIWPADSFNAPATNMVESILQTKKRLDLSPVEQTLSPDWRKMMPALDKMVSSSSDPEGFWQKCRALARLWTGDIIGAGKDDPAFAVPARDPRCTPEQVDLSRWYTGLLVSDCIGNGLDWGALRPGLQTLGGVQFDLRGFVRLGGTNPNAPGFPREARGVPIDQRIRRLHALQWSHWDLKDGVLIAKYILHYADGQTRELPVISGEDVRDWWGLPNSPTNAVNAQIVWTGSNRHSTADKHGIRLWKRTYENPRPEVTIATLDLVSEMNYPAPVLMALSVEP